MQHEPRQAFANLAKMERELDVYGDGGFYDAVAVGSGTVAQRYLSLDQAMVHGRDRQRGRPRRRAAGLRARRGASGRSGR